ncbi:MAG: DUF6516 family protein [bacterium]
MIRGYFQRVEGLLSKCPLAINFQYNFTVVDVSRGFWKGSVEFRRGFELHLFEYVVVERGVQKIDSYRYHFQDFEGELVFRSDNAPHHPELESHPHHLHQSGTVSSTMPQPELEAVLDKAIRKIQSNNAI